VGVKLYVMGATTHFGLERSPPFTLSKFCHNCNSTAKEVMSKHHVVARDQDIKNAHIDKNKGRPPEEYYGTFVDLYLGIQAKCVVFGVGNYALFASKLGGRKCKMRYAREVWGSENTTHKRETQECALPFSKGIEAH